MPPLIITHWDLDGYVSAILLLNAVGDCDIKFANAGLLSNVLSGITGNEEIPEDIYLADLPLDSGLRASMLSKLQTLEDRGVALHLFDHHAGWESTGARSVFTTNVVDTSKTTAASLIILHFGLRSQGCGRWLELLSKKDQSSDSSVREDFKLLSALCQKPFRGVRVQALKDLAFGRMFPKREEILDWYDTTYLKKEDFYQHSAEIIETVAGTKVAWVDLQGENLTFPGLAPKVIRALGADLCAVFTQGGIWLSTAHIDAGRDLSFLHGRHVAGSIQLTVFGHKSPIAIRPVESPVDDWFLQEAKGFINERL